MAKKAKRARSKTDKVVYSGIGEPWTTLKYIYDKYNKDIFGKDGYGLDENYELFKKIHSDVLTDNTPEKNIKDVVDGNFHIFKAIVNNELTSIYIETCFLFDFLKNTPPKDSDINAVCNSIKNLKEILVKGIAIHLPNEKDSIILKILPFDDGGYVAEDGACFIYVSKRPFRLLIPIHPQRKNWQYCANLKNIALDKKKELKRQETWNTVINLLLYMDCFSECVIDGVPDIICKGDEAKRKKTITLHKDIEEVSRQAQITPHMRRGHFRFLQSDRYVNAKGKTVFVKPTMVKGKAKTVIEY